MAVLLRPVSGDYNNLFAIWQMLMGAHYVLDFVQGTYI
jgi:hypothetical protein